MAAKAKKADAEADNPEDEAGQSGGKAKKKKLPLKLIVMVAAALLVLGGGGAAAYMFLGHSQHSEAKKKETKAKPAVFVDMPDVLVNLSNTGSDRTQYLKVKIVLEVPDTRWWTRSSR